MTNQNSKFEKDQFKDQFKQRVKQYILKLIRLVDSLSPDQTSKVISYQLIRSGMSIGANYFEARAASSKNDFTNFFTYSLKSANESKFWLETLLDAKKCDALQGVELLQETSEIANVLASSILTLKGKK